MNKFLRVQSLLSATFSLFVALTFGVNSYAQCVAPNANGVTINCGQTATLTASTPGGLVQWYDAAVNGNLLQTGNSFTTPALTTNTSYWVQNQYVSVGGNQSVTFNYNGGMQQWTVPAGVTSITVDARGAEGGGYSFGSGGLGGKAVATIPVVPGQTIYVFVGQSPGYGGYTNTYNGGGSGYYSSSSYSRGMSGGGASDVRIGGTALSDRKVVAGGGGGAGPYYYGYCYSNNGGAGGNTTGGNGLRCGWYSGSYCGAGGTQAAGGAGASGYPSGTLGDGGGNGFRGGGGGGGYYGGGAGYYGGGGGGGSNYAIPQATNVVHSQGVQYGNGQVIITYQTVNVNCTSARTQVNVTVTLPAAPTANAAVVNCGATAALSASGGTGTYAWFSNAAGTTQVGTGANFTTPQLTANTTYYVGSTSAGGGGAAGTVYTFTNCSATGQFGPTQAQVNSAYTGTNLAGNVTSQSGVQLWTVPSSGTYRIEAFGAQGGGNNQFGRGAQIRGDFSLTAGQQLKIIVGQQGGYYQSGSGGGGSFVATSANVPLLVAGGGGGQYDGSSALYNAHAVTVNGGQPTGCTTGGAGGNGGNGCTSSGAAGGGGFTGNGGTGTYGTGGASFTNGGNGGNHGSNAICVGGFGGGGGTHGNTGGGGGGGGYSGGAGGYHSGSTGSGGGGGSYNNGTNQVNVGGVRIGHGLVTITSMSSSCVSAVVPVAITVNPPTTPTANNVTINCGNTATLTASNGTGTYVWYSDPAGTQQVATGASFTTPVLVSGTTYYVGTSAGQAGCNANTLSNILSGVNTNGAAIAAAVPNGYNFSMDGPNGANSTYISDGGNDMYDGGNYINTNLGNNITYSDGVIANSAAFGAGGQYFTKKLTNMWVLAADVNNISSFSITGNNGADGGGSYNGTTLTVTVGCQTYKVMLKRVYNAGDPSINQMVIIPNNAGATHTWATNTDNTQHDITGLAGTTRLYYLLYAGSNGGYIDDNAATNIATTFLTQISATTAAQALCQSNLAPVQITVNSNIAQPVVSGTTTINCGATTTLTSSSGNNTAWYSAAANGNLLGTGSTYTTTSLAAGTTIYAMQATINAGSQTFNYTGSQQTWTVPAGVTSVTVDVQGAQGGSTGYGTAGMGGRTQATIPVTPGATVFINVGGQGNYSTGGWNGGGTPYGCGCVGGGGGASDIRIGGNALANRAIVAGGGGGGGYYWNWTNDHGGHGGGLTGEAGKTNNGYNPTYCGQGGTQAAGGAGASQGGPAGSLGNGGGSGYYAGSGGGGYYGGGSGYAGGGGGGGSSFANNQATGVTHTQGYKSGNGLITITWNSVGCASSPVAVPIAVNALAAPTANNTVIGCGTTAALTASGGGGNTYTWYTNANGTGQVGTGANYTSPALSANTTYYVTANAGLAAGTAFNFSNASATGRTGPTQAQVNAAYSGTNLAGNVTVNTQGIQEWIVPQTGMYRIQANGAQGGGTGGLGARMQGDFSLTQGQKLFIVVGQQGLGPVNSGACGGGGGSFVAVGSASYTTSTALIVAGGGGGASPQQGQPGLITTNGGQGESCQVGGTNGNGGADASSCGSGTGGGGGFLTNGAMGGAYGNQGGYGFLSGAALGGTSQSGAREGGFGGGGGTHSNNTGGGPGGGYSGGSAPYHGTNYEGGGGGSYNNGTNPVNTQGVQAGNGTVVITPLTSPCASPVTPVTVTVNPLTAPVANNVTINCGQTAALSASNNLGAIVWYSTAAGTTQLGTGASFTTPQLSSTTTYYVGAGTGACATAINPVTVTVSALANPTVNANVAVNCGQTAVLTASNGGGATYTWYTNAAGTTVAGTGASFTTPGLNANTTYYVASTTGVGGGTTWTFTNCSATGQFGPTQAQVNAAYTATSLAGLVTSSNGIQLWTVPTTGAYRIEAFGAQGGGNNQFGRGAQIRGDFNLTAGQQLKILVGQQGGVSSSGSGGGGSFVATSANVPLIVAGGGGGQYDSGSALYNAHAVTANNGQATGCTSGGAGGNGGNGCNNSGAAGGGGFTGNGGTGTYGTGGASFTNGGNGGNHGSNANCVGGFGGGGGTHGNTGGGGGGGGYSGGAGGYHSGNDGSGGGGGSYNNGTNQVNTGGVRTGHGQVIITSLSTPCSSNLIPVAVAVNPLTAPTAAASAATVNCGQTSVLTAQGGSGNTYTWYSNANGSTQVATGASFTTPALSGNTTYYVASTTPQGGSQTFNYTGGVQTFTAPATGVYTLDVYGARGGNITSYYVTSGGLGGRAQGTINLTAGQVINIYVGGQGQDRLGNHPYGSCTLTPGGWNGGGANRSAGNGSPGGGASDIRVGGNALANRVIVAGGGGGCGWTYAAGGAGGGLTGGAGTNHPSGPGTQANGGPAGTNSGGCGQTAGTLGQGGDGSGSSAGGGGGGGGYYGGGGGGYDQGGGGGSSYIGGVTNGTTTPGVRNGDGQIIITWSGAGCVSPLVPVAISVTPLATPTVSASAAAVNCGQTSVLTAQGGNGSTYTWFTNANGTNQVGTGASFTTPALSTSTTYYVAATAAPACSSAIVPMAITVNGPAAPVAANAIVNCGNPTTLNAANGGGQVYTWYTDSLATQQVGTGASYTTPTLSTTTTYYVNSGTAMAPAATYTFTNANASGASGPTQAQLNSAYSGTNLAGQVTSSNGIQLWTVPQTGVYTIDARGARGGSYPGRNSGGNGARMVGTFNLTAGQQIKILVGQEGYYGGGGGGSFVATSANVPLIVAGGGGGGGSACGGPIPHAGTAVNGGNSNSPCTGSTYQGGINGAGGNGPGGNGGPGGGFNTNGTPGDGNAGQAFVNGGSGSTVGWYGGFGGGGGTTDDQGAGGGGYSGGAGDVEDGDGGAGGSYNSGTNQSNTAAFQAGMGQVIITRMSSPCVSVVTPVTVTVNAIAAPTVAGNTTLCANGVATTTLTASGGGGNSYTWYANANGTGQLGTNAAFTTPGLNNTTTYYVQSVTPQGGSQTFNYTGTAQTFTAPVSGTYTLEAWGAQGGNDPSNPNAIFGGRGGYAKGDVYLNAGQTIQVYVGQQGSGCLNSSWRSTGGGGATDFRLNGGNWNDNAGLLSRILVAGGGGGRHGNNYEGVAYVGNDGGGSTAPNFTANGVNVVGSTQNGGGSSNNTNVAGSFGFANPTPYSNSCSVGGWNGGARGSDNWANGGGGGGWYGGVSSWPTGSGGSGYAYTAASWTPGGYTPTATYQLANTQLISGNASMPNPAGGNMTGRAGNGIAKITWSGTGCASSVTPVTVTVNALPAAPSANAAAICTGQTATLNASANANWYTVPNGGVSIGQAQAYTTPSLNNTVTYYMEGVNGPCVSATRTPVTVTVNPGPASNAGSSIVDASTCGKNTVNVGGNALAAGQSGQWSVLSATNNGGNPGVFSLAGTSANDQFTGAYGGTYVLQWQITNQSNGCIGMDTMVVTFNQPVDAVINGLIGQGDLLWCGLTGTDWSTSTNWYQKQAAGHYVRMSGAVQPSIANEVFTVSIANGGMCIGSNNPSLSTNSNAEDVYVGPGITWNLSNDSINIAQNLINNGTIIASTGIVNFTGSSNSTVSGSGNTQLFNMRVNKSAGATLTLQQPVLVTNTLTMNQGNVFTTSANLLTLGTSSAAPGSLTYNSGTIVGPFKRYFANVATAGTAGLFPVGTAVYNRYADFSFGSGPGVDQFLTVEYKPGAPMQGGIPLYNGLPLMASGSMIQNYSADGYWSVIPTNNNYTAPITSVNYGVTLFANNLTGMQSPQVCRIIKSAGSNNAAQHHVAWQACGTHTPINGAANPQSFLITSTATQGFSWFNIGTPNSQALPVELLSFNGDCNEGQVNLTWQTATEHNSDYFEVEKSRDGMNWQVLTTVNAAGNSTQLLNYEATDAQAMEGNNYYRLTQVDIDGTTKTYDVINVSCSGASKGYFSAYPNPSTGSFQVILNDKNLVGSGILSVKDTKGAELLNRTIEVKPGINMFSVTDLNLAPGVYYIQIVNGERATEVLKEVIR